MAGWLNAEIENWQQMLTENWNCMHNNMTQQNTTVDFYHRQFAHIHISANYVL